VNRNRSYGWRRRLSVDSMVLVASVAYPMIVERKPGAQPSALDSGDPILAGIADELNSRLGPGADQEELWNPGRVRGVPGQHGCWRPVGAGGVADKATARDHGRGRGPAVRRGRQRRVQDHGSMTLRMGAR
jgi:hypothetical protein